MKRGPDADRGPVPSLDPVYRSGLYSFLDQEPCHLLQKLFFYRFVKPLDAGISVRTPQVWLNTAGSSDSSVPTLGATYIGQTLANGLPF